MQETVWAFDLGIASIGEAVRKGNQFLHKASLLIPPEFASTKDAAQRRRAWRTRQAHKAREQWLREVMQKAGIEVLHGKQMTWNEKKKKWDVTPGDKRLESEFAKPGDPTCYTSCLLRIKLLRGEKLEPWQIYKALHSAIQRRGYDPDIPWKTQEQQKTKTDDANKDEASTKERMHQFEKDLEAMCPGKSEYQYPCYFDAWKMGLWNPSEPENLKQQIDCHAKSTRNQIIPRRLVDKEIRALIEAAAKHYPKLKDKTDFFLYGPTEEAYASFYAKLRKEHKLKQGSANDWQGVLGQKIPRFDNRIIGKCILIPRMNVCKIKADDNGEIHPQSRLAAEVTFLTKLKNMRIQRNKKAEGLTAKEIQSIFENKDFEKLAITESVWKKKVCAPLGAVPLPGHECVEKPKISGRSRFCRPALDILKRLILSGISPKEFYKQELSQLNGNKNPIKGLVEDDLKFLLKMGETWEGIYIPNQKLDALIKNSDNANKAIQTLIGSQNNPIVRHRLNLFVERLNELADKYGKPESVVLEFVREDFMGRKAKLKYNKFIKDRATERIQFRQEAKAAGANERAAGLKMELLRAQGGRCLYTSTALIPEELDTYCIDHIVPRAKGGPDSIINYVLTTAKINDDKGKRTPYEWLFGKEGWDAYVNRVRERAGTLRNKKVQLLISPDAETLIQKYTALAETAWISKLSQAILDLKFGWQNGNDKQSCKRVIIVSGGLTGRIRRKYKLNHILNPEAQSEEEAEKKNRDDDRHHALDAMIISFIPNWARDTKRTDFFRFPDGVNKELFAREIVEVIPQNVCFEKPALAETIYGVRQDSEDKVIVQRVKVVHLAMKPAGIGKTKFDLAYATDQIKTIRDSQIRKQLMNFLLTKPTEEAWNRFCESFTLPRKDGTTTSQIKSVRLTVGNPPEYKDLSKDQTGSYRKALKGHKGQIVYLDDKGKPRVRPIYVFESITKVKQELLKSLSCPEKIHGFYQSGCLIEIDKTVPHTKKSLPPGKYLVNTIITDSKQIKVTNSSGQTYPNIPVFHLSKFIAAGMRRID